MIEELYYIIFFISGMWINSFLQNISVRLIFKALGKDLKNKLIEYFIEKKS